MKNTWFICILILIAARAHAQNNLFSLGVDVNIPQDVLTTLAKTGWGTSFRYERILKPRLNATATASLIFFAKKSVSQTKAQIVATTKSTMIPVQAGLKYYIFQSHNGNGLFLTGETGIHIMMAKGTINGSDVPINTETHFSYSAGIGYRLRKVELAFRQQFISVSGDTFTYSNIRLSVLLNKQIQ